MWTYPRILAHRGGGSLAPENTLAAIRCGMAYGYRAVEFDAMLSADGVPVLMHDPEFGRTVAGRGKVCNTSAQELTGMDAGAWFGPHYAGEPVPELERVIRFCRENAIWMNIEIKPSPGCEERTGAVVAETASRLCAADSAPPLLSSFSFEALMAARSAAPDMARGLLVDAMPPDWRERLRELDAVALHANHRKLTSGTARAVKQAGYGLLCYTVNDPGRARRILSWGVDAFCTDRIDLIAADFPAGGEPRRPRVQEGGYHV
jgi:glycerophosphoryl diester phosphodiesterase